MKYIMRDSLLHIDDEGGLVHMGTALGTMCIVLFGPTPMDVLGYPQNINICSYVCPGCFSFIDGWNSYCFRGGNAPDCMYSISPEIVMKKIVEFLDAKEKNGD